MGRGVNIELNYNVENPVKVKANSFHKISHIFLNIHRHSKKKMSQTKKCPPTSGFDLLTFSNLTQWLTNFAKCLILLGNEKQDTATVARIILLLTSQIAEQVVLSRQIPRTCLFVLSILRTFFVYPNTCTIALVSIKVEKITQNSDKFFSYQKFIQDCLFMSFIGRKPYYNNSRSRLECLIGILTST